MGKVVSRTVQTLEVISGLKTIGEILAWLFGAGGGAAIVAGLIKQFVASIDSTALILLGIGLFLILLTVLPFIINSLRSKKHKDVQTSANHINDKPNLLDKITYYKSRDEAPELIKQLKDSEKAWVLWHVGGIAEPTSDYTKIQRMILVHPNSRYLDDLATMTVSESNDLYKRLDWLIGKMIKLRRNSNEDNIHLYRGLPSTLITFANPEGNNARVLIQVIVPYEKATNRPCIVVEKSTNEPLYRRILDYFEKTWEESKKPENDPYSETSNEPAITPTKSMPDWLEKVLIDDRNNFADRIKIGENDDAGHLRWVFSDTSEPYIQIKRRVHNQAVFPISISVIEGHITIEGVTCQAPLRLLGESRLGKGWYDDIVIHQPVSLETARMIREIHSNKGMLRIDLRSCFFIVKSEELDYERDDIRKQVGDQFYLQF